MGFSGAFLKKRFSVYPIIALLFLISLALRAYVIYALRFDGLYGQDPYAYYDYGQQVYALLRHGQGLGHFYYPLGYPILVSLGFLFTGVQASGALAVSLICGAALTVFGGLLTLEIGRALGFSERAIQLGGIATWSVLTVCGQLLQSSIVIMSDVPALLGATVSAWALFVYGRSGRPFWIGLAAFTLAWASMTRWQYAGLGVPWLLYCLLLWKFRPRWSHGVLAVLVGLITLTPQLIYTRQGLDPLAQPIGVQSWSLANAFSRDFVTADGTAHYAEMIAVYYLKPLTSPYYTSIVFLPLMLIGLLGLLRRAAPAVLIVGWIGIQYGFLAGLPLQNIRYPLAFYTPLAVLAGLGVAQVIQRLARQIHFQQVAAAALLGLLISIGLANTLSTALDLVTGFVGNKDRELATVRWVESAIPEANATIYGLDLTLTLQHYSSLKPVQIYYESPASMAARLPADRPAYALFNVDTTETQWQGKTPWLIYHWLLDQPGLMRIGSYGAYTLYRVATPDQ